MKRAKSWIVLTGQFWQHYRIMRAFQTLIWQIMSGYQASACLRRVAQLEANNVIDGYHANVNAGKIGYDVLVLMHITLRGQSAAMMAEFEDAVSRIPQVLACFLIAGGNDYILRVAALDVNDFGRIHSTDLSALPHVLRMESNFVLREVINRGMPA
jgi:Lrp/AsnC family leucine-responsive transcriptional regulator